MEAKGLEAIILCPGQGAQAVGMGQAWRDASGAAAGVFAEPDGGLGVSLGPPPGLPRAPGDFDVTGLLPKDAESNPQGTMTGRVTHENIAFIGVGFGYGYSLGVAGKLIWDIDYTPPIFRLAAVAATTRC